MRCVSDLTIWREYIVNGGVVADDTWFKRGALTDLIDWWWSTFVRWCFELVEENTTKNKRDWLKPWDKVVANGSSYYKGWEILTVVKNDWSDTMTLKVSNWEGNLWVSNDSRDLIEDKPNKEEVQDKHKHRFITIDTSNPLNEKFCDWFTKAIWRNDRPCMDNGLKFWYNWSWWWNWYDCVKFNADCKEITYEEWYHTIYRSNSEYSKAQNKPSTKSEVTINWVTYKSWQKVMVDWEERTIVWYCDDDDLILRRTDWEWRDNLENEDTLFEWMESPHYEYISICDIDEPKEIVPKEGNAWERKVWDYLVITDPELARDKFSEDLIKWKKYKVVSVRLREPWIIDEKWYENVLDSVWWYEKVEASYQDSYDKPVRNQMIGNERKPIWEVAWYYDFFQSDRARPLLDRQIYWNSIRDLIKSPSELKETFNPSIKTPMTKFNEILKWEFFTKSTTKAIVKEIQEWELTVSLFNTIVNNLIDIRDELREDVADLKRAFNEDDICDTKEERANVQAKMKDISWSSDLKAILMIAKLYQKKEQKWTWLWDLVPKKGR